MAWNDSSELVVASNGQVSVAPIGTALPTSTTGALNAAFIGLGFITEDGATLTITPDITEHAAWQSRQPVRRDINAQEITISFALEQWDEDSVPLAFGGGEITGTAPSFRFDFPSEEDPLDERALVLDAQDGDTNLRFVFPKGNVTEAVETQFTRSALAILPITFSVLAPEGGGSPGYFLTDAAGFAAGS